MTLIRTVDFETTGLIEDADASICEIGWTDVRFDDGVAVVVDGPVSFLCNPGVSIRPEIRAIHHIGDGDVVDSPTPAVGREHLIDGSPDYFCAHSADFERFFFDGGETPWICTYKVAVRLWPDAPNHKNQTLRYYLDLDLPDEAAAMPPHRAGPDSYVTAHILVAELNDGRASIDEMVRRSNGPALLPKVTFGTQHFGSKWEDVPTDYLNWIVNKSRLDNDVKANARHHLKLRSNAEAAA